jgi:ABC-type antimicrobial peptide transport system permease subunit
LRSRTNYDRDVVAVSGSVTGALVGLLIGVALSVYVALLDYRKRQSGTRTRAQYRLSLFGVPAILATIGALIGAAIAH